MICQSLRQGDLERVREPLPLAARRAQARASEPRLPFPGRRAGAVVQAPPAPATAQAVAPRLLTAASPQCVRVTDSS
jgi:hypothetical protein